MIADLIFTTKNASKMEAFFYSLYLIVLYIMKYR